MYKTCKMFKIDLICYYNARAILQCWFGSCYGHWLQSKRILHILTTSTSCALSWGPALKQVKVGHSVIVAKGTPPKLVSSGQRLDLDVFWCPSLHFCATPYAVIGHYERCVNVNVLDGVQVAGKRQP